MLSEKLPIHRTGNELSTGPFFIGGGATRSRTGLNGFAIGCRARRVGSVPLVRPAHCAQPVRPVGQKLTHLPLPVAPVLEGI